MNLYKVGTNFQNVTKFIVAESLGDMEATFHKWATSETLIKNYTGRNYEIRTVELISITDPISTSSNMDELILSEKVVSSDV